MRRIAKILIRISALVIVSGVVAAMVGELYVSRFKPQVTYTQAYLLSDKCYAPSDVTPFTLAPGARCRMLEQNGDFDLTITINPLGYRGPEFQPVKPEGRKRILMVGDSFAFGYGLADGSTIADHLTTILEATGSGAEVINAGFHAGFSPDSYYAYLREEGIRLKPDLVIALFFPFNDLNDLTETKWEEVDERGLPRKVYSDTRIVQDGIFRFRKTSIEYRYPVVRDSHVFQWFIRTTRDRFDWFHEKSLAPIDGSYRVGCSLDHLCIDILLKEEDEEITKIFRGTQLLLAEQGIRFAVVVIPADYQVYPEAFKKYIRTRPVNPAEPDFYQKRFLKNVGQMSLPVLDLFGRFVAHRNDSGEYPFFPHDAHFNPVGSHVAAASIAGFILDRQLLP